MRDEHDLRHGDLNGFDSANEKVLSLGVGAATTLTAVEVNGCEIRAFDVGDSFMLITGQRGKVKLQLHTGSRTIGAETAERQFLRRSAHFLNERRA